MNKSEFLTAWSKLHGDAQVSGVVKAWLNISYLISKPLSRIGVTPNALTISGLFFWNHSLSIRANYLGTNTFSHITYM